MTGIAPSPAELAALRRAVDLALEEDLAYGPDATTAATVGPEAAATAEFRSRVDGVPGGIGVVEMVYAAVHAMLPGPSPVKVTACRADGVPAPAGTVLVRVTGPVRMLLTGERTALNLVSRLSGTATVTAAWVSAVAGTGCAIRDTRKTTPGLRLAEKYAVRCGGGVNHRLGLGDAVLVKDNHVAAAGSVTAALAAVRASAPHLPCQVEVDDLDQLDEAIAAGAESVLLDNFDVESCAEAVRRVQHSGAGDVPTNADGARGRNGRVILEASGGLTLKMARAYAETGVDYLAVGALTHSAPALDIGLDLL